MAGLFPPPADLPPSWELEHQARSLGFRLIAGVDEVGRGPLAGPVVAAAVILPFGLIIEGVRDSKTVPEEDRPAVVERILSQARAVGLGAAGPGEIDRLNIREASLLAMIRAVSALGLRPDFLLVDGRDALRLPLAQRAVIKGDGRSASVAAASLVAKVARDRMMRRWDRVFPGYGLARHKGYGTSEHLEAVLRLGPTFIHRRSFGPVRAAARAQGLWDEN